MLYQPSHQDSQLGISTSVDILSRESVSATHELKLKKAFLKANSWTNREASKPALIGPSLWAASSFSDPVSVVRSMCHNIENSEKHFELCFPKVLLSDEICQNFK